MPQKMYLRVALGLRIAIWAGIVLVILFGRKAVESGLFGCVWYNHFGVLCSTCGGSRAVLALLSGDLMTAAQLNPVVTFGLLPIFLFLVLSDLFLVIWNLFGKKRRLTPLEYCIAVFGATFTQDRKEK